MRRSIMSRGLWLALSAAMVAATIVVIARSRRRPPGPRPVRQDEAVSDTSLPARTESEPASPWPPVPVLGTPTADDLQRYTTRPSVLDGPAFARMFEEREPRQPLDEAVRRRLIRWGVAGLALLLLAGGAQVLESAVFSKEAGGETNAVSPCAEVPPEMRDACSFAEVQTLEVPNSDSGEAPGQVQAHGWVPDADCRPENATPRVRKLNAKVARAVDRQWRRIEAWLKTNAPRSHRTLGKPGEPEVIAAAEAEMGSLFPDDLRASLLRHDGVVHLDDIEAFGFLGNSNASVREIRDTWRQLCLIDDEDDGTQGFTDPRTEWWDGRMLPFGSDGLGDHLVVDSVKRDVGDTDHEGIMSFTPGGVRIRSYYALLKATADAMEDGGSIGYWKPEAVAGELRWKAG
ncbi:SMI1/KNR4 family protein [Nonomuraea dietziae]|uniref:SMI1/KNR4 family protein n=1 Tax=Nonomuraea dietziae TaxID=65515 RepID=UPI003439589D